MCFEVSGEIWEASRFGNKKGMQKGMRRGMQRGQAAWEAAWLANGSRMAREWRPHGFFEMDSSYIEGYIEGAS